MVGSILARSLFRLRHPLAAVCGNTGGPVGCACHGAARIPDVDYAGATTPAQHVRKYPSHVLQARRLVSGVTQQPAAGTPGDREAVRVRASRLDPREARTSPGGRQSARPQTEGARATQYCGFERCASGDAACGCRRSFAIGPDPRIDFDRCPGARGQPGHFAADRSAASFRCRPGLGAWDGFLEASGDCAQYGGCCPSSSCAGVSPQRWGHQHRSDRSGRARTPVADGRTTPNFGSAPVSDWEPYRMGCAASAYGSAFRNIVGWARGIALWSRVQCRAASAVGPECRQLGRWRTHRIVIAGFVR